MFDILIKNGSIIDGSGKGRFLGDIGIRNDKIAAIGEFEDEKGEIEIDAEGKIVCPGFIDVNNHSDVYWRIFNNPDLPSLVYQGITTIVGGNCGSSLAPLASAKNIESIQKWTDLKNINVNWLSVSEFFDVLGENKLPVNFGTLVGHATLRRGIIQDEVRSLSPKELGYIEKKLAEGLKEGALGISTGLVYTHARLASSEELINLARLVGKHDGVYATHIRDESNEIIESLEEAIKIGQESGTSIHISHLKAVGRKNWNKMEEALAIIDRASESGIKISFDVYPYTNTGSVLYTLLPAWVAEGGKRVMLHRLKDPATRAKAVLEMKESDFEYENVEIAISPIDKTLTRRKITEIARSHGQSVEEAIVDILIASEGRVITSIEALNVGNVAKAIAHPLAIIATNGSGYDVEHSKTGEMIHPRSFGTFIKVLKKYVLEDDVLTFEDAVRKMTSFPAEKFGISGRGLLKEGYFADVLVLNGQKLEASSSPENPYRYSKGVEYSFVNGKMAVEEGEYIGVKNGRIIKR
jgi:N-acyl-D-amino-acid deacylase